MRRSELIETIQRQVVAMMTLRSELRPEPWLHSHLSMAQVKALFGLRQRGSARVGMVAEWLGLSPNATTAVLDHLEADGLVLRSPDPSDRRAVIVALSPHGMAVVDDLLNAGTRELVAELDRLSNEELEALGVGAAALTRAMRERLAEQQEARGAEAGAPGGS